MRHIKPVIEFRDDILKLHMMYLEKRDDMSDRERAVFCNYFDRLSRPAMMVERDFKFEKELLDDI